jgi:methionyl-tRNA formyltransferase
MRLIFAGTPEFAERALRALLDAGHEIALVLTRADQPAGRGQRLQASPVKALALAHGLTVFQPRSLRDADAQQRIAEVAADAMVVAAYGLILPPAVLAMPRLGCINIHASLLPRWRGAAPIQRAIEAGDAVTGVTIMQMDAGLDTGAMLLAREVPIAADDTGGSLHDKLAQCGAALIVEALARLARGALPAEPQPAEGATYAAKIQKTETLLDWRLPARTLADRVRAFDPFPGSVLHLARGGEPLKLWRARAAQAGEAPPPASPSGAVLRVTAEGILVACGAGALWLLTLQKPGGRRLPAAQFLQGFPVAPGERFALPDTAVPQ